MRERQEAAIFDMDGTLCDVSGIRHLLHGPGGFRAFHRASASCPPHAWVVDAARAQAARGRAVLVFTAREALHRNVTAMWLALHQVPSDAMWMRGIGDGRPDVVVKAEMLAWAQTMYWPVAAWEDQPSIADLWRDVGLDVTGVPGWGGP